MNKFIIVGEVLSGFDHYSQRIDEFKKTFTAKMAFITDLAENETATPVIIGGIKERTADLENLPVIIDSFYKSRFYVCGIHKKRTPIKDVLVAAKCIENDIKGVVIIDDAKDIPVAIIDANEACWIIYSGDYADLVPMESLISESVSDGKINGIITNSQSNESKIAGVFVAPPLFRSKQESTTPSVLLVNGKTVTQVTVRHDAHIFDFKNPSDGEVAMESSEFVRRLKQESDAARDESSMMDSHKNLETMIEKFATELNLNPVAKGIVDNLMHHTNQ